MRQALVSTLETYLPLDLQGRELDDETLWDILLYASVNGTTIESACSEWDEVPSSNTVRDHLRGGPRSVLLWGV